MLFIILTSFHQHYLTFLQTTEKYFNSVLAIPNSFSSIKDKYVTKLKSTNVITFQEHESNGILNNHLFNGFSLIVKDSDYIKHSETQFYSINIKPVGDQIYIETKDFKKKIKLNEDDITNVVIECFKYGYPSIAYNYKNKNYLFKGTNQFDIPVISIDNMIKSVKSTSTTSLTSSEIENKYVKYRFTPLTNWTTTEYLINYLNKFKPKNSEVEFSLENPNAVVVFNSTNVLSNPQKTIYFCMEPNGETLYSQYLSNFKKDSNLDKYEMLYYGGHSQHLNMQEYWLPKTVDELSTFEIIGKTKALSVCISDRCYDPGQIYRINLVRRLDDMSKEGKLNFKLDIYGKCKSLNFKNYISECPERDKSNATFKYKYHFNAENHPINNYITEKFYDALFSECYLFYYGAPNAKDIFKDCFSSLSGNIDEDVETIIKSINEDVWESKIDRIKRAKQLSLVGHNMYNRLETICDMAKTIVLRILPPFMPMDNVDIMLYQKESWHLLAKANIGFDESFAFVKQLIQQPMQYKTNLLILPTDIEGSHDKISFVLSFVKDADMILLDNKSKFAFFNPVFITIQGIQKLFDKLNSGVIGYDNLVSDLKIINVNEYLI